MRFDKLQFRHPWRPYQRRVLDAIEDHLQDRRLHVVAAPGAGKTTLGLEIFRRLGKSALVLSPTRVIRDQWLARLGDFIRFDDGKPPAWTSRDLRSPGVLTSITYQALHTRVCSTSAEDESEDDLSGLEQAISDSETADLIESLRTGSIEVIIMDEAHHLRAAWWKALSRVCDEMPELTLVSLTATPPYDSVDHEWSRYEALCGPIDEEISVPELVKTGTLCPHQDYIWAVDASASERQKIREHDRRVDRLCDSLFASAEFEAIVGSHPWRARDPDHRDLLREPQIAVAILVYLQRKQLQLPPALLEALDLREADIPDLGRYWWQQLVHAVLFSPTFALNENHRESVAQLKKQLRASELLHKRELSLEKSRRMARSLGLSAAKVKACLDIHRIELRQRGEGLRQVVLTSASSRM